MRAGLPAYSIIRTAARTPSCSSPSRERRGPSIMTRKDIAVALLLAVLCAIVALISPQFLSVTNLQNVSRLVGTYGIFSIGVGLVIITGGIDLSVGSICALLGVLLSMMLVEWHGPPAVALAAALAVGAGLGAVHGVLVS